MKYRSSITQGLVIVSFEAKPDDRIRSALKANGFRWQRHDARWEARFWKGAADFLAWLDRAMNPGRPDGACWTCKNPQGFFRPRGAACPVLCNECHQAELARERGERAALDVDRLYEDQCREACGL
jgi:hypothetical protein